MHDFNRLKPFNGCSENVFDKKAQAGLKTQDPALEHGGNSIGQEEKSYGG